MKKLFSILMFLALLLTFVPQAPVRAQGGTETATLQPNGASMSDTQIVSGSSASTNYGTQTTFSVGEVNNDTKTFRSLLKFDLSGLPNDATVVTATLSLWVDADYSDNARIMHAYPILEQWTESQATWNVRQTGVNWQTAGAAGASDVGSSIGSVSLANNLTAGTQVNMELDPAAVQAMLHQNYFGFKLQMETETDDTYAFRSSDHATSAERPQLVIEYTPDTPIPDPGWLCVDGFHSVYNCVDTTTVLSPFYLERDNHQVMNIIGGPAVGMTAAKLQCSPYPMCINDYPIYYRIEYWANWTASVGSGPGETIHYYLNIDVPGGTDVNFDTQCDAQGSSGDCRGVLDGSIPISSLPINYGTTYTLAVEEGFTTTNQWPSYGYSEWTIYFSLEPFDQDCSDIYQVPTPETYVIDPTLETPLGPSGTPADYQIHETVIGNTYMVRVEDGPWNDGTTDRTDAQVSSDGTTWIDWDVFTMYSVCVDIDPLHPEDDYRVIYFIATTETFYIRVNDTAGNFGDNENDVETPFSYVIGAALSCEDQFNYDPETDTIASISVASTSDDVDVSDVTESIIGGEWYGIEVTSGSWHENSPTTPRTDMEFSFVIFGPQQEEPEWTDLAQDSPLVGCRSLDSAIYFVQAPLVNGLVLHLRANDQDDPQNFTDNTGTLEVSIYHTSYTYIPTGCAGQIGVDDLVASGLVYGDQVSGKGFANSFTSINGVTEGGVSTSYYLKLGGWYVLQTKDGPWIASSASGSPYTAGGSYYDVQIKRWSSTISDDWSLASAWTLASCVVTVDALGHQRIYFQVPDNNAQDENQGGAEYMIRVAGSGAGVTGSIGWDLYQAIDIATMDPQNPNPWDTCLDDWGTLPELNHTFIPVKQMEGAAIVKHNSGGGTVPLLSGNDYWITTSDGPWQDGENPDARYDAQLSSDGGATWYSFAEHPGVTCAVEDQLGQYTTTMFTVATGDVWMIRVADTTSAIFSDNTGTLAYSIFHAVYVPTYDPEDYGQSFDACSPHLIRPVLTIVSAFDLGAHIVPDLPSVWNPEDWVPYLGLWFDSQIGFIGQGIEIATTFIGDVLDSFANYFGGWVQYVDHSMQAYFAWCPRHVNILMVGIHEMEGKEPFGTVDEMMTATDTTIAELKGYDWGASGEGGGVGDDGYEDTSIFSFEGGGSGPAVNTVDEIVERILPTTGEAVDIWDGGPIVDFGGSTDLPTYYYSCSSAFADYLPARLRDGACFASAYWKETGAAFWLQLSFDIFTVFMLWGMIKGSAQSLIYMMTGVRPWTKDGIKTIIMSEVQDENAWRRAHNSEERLLQRNENNAIRSGWKWK